MRGARIGAWVACFVLATAAQRASAQASDAPLAITGVRILADAQGRAAVENATVIVRGERIVAVGAGIPLPRGARHVDASGKVLTAGLVSVVSGLGLVEIGLEPNARDVHPEGRADPIRAAFDAVDGVNPRSSLVVNAREGGITLALAAPRGGLVAGTSALFDLRGDAPDAAVVRERVALHVQLDDGGVGAAGGARPAAWLRLREALDDARLFARRRDAFDRRQMRQSRVSRLDLVRLADAVAGRLPVVLRVSRANDILRALALGREYGLKLVLAGVEEGWVVAGAIAKARVPVIVHPLANLPSSFARIGTRYDNAALLAAAGVPVILTASEAHRAHNLRQEAGNAVARGLSPEAALAAVTSVPARALGVEKDYGSIAPGKVASFVLWSGDPFELSTRAEHVFVRGREQSTRGRQGALFERYRTLPLRPGR